MRNHAFSDGAVAVDEIFCLAEFHLLSLCNVDKAGLVDILPVTMWTRSAASLEAIVGVLYITIIMARLVGLYASREMEEKIYQKRFLNQDRS